jgi:amino acid transporter
MMGPVGRIVIGVVAIAGAGAAVNYLYQSVARMMACMARQGLLPAIFARSPARPLLALSGLAATTGLLMAAGFAGSDLLDVSIRAGLMLWLVFYALRQIAQSRRTRQTSGSGYALHAARNSARRIIVSAAMITAAAIIGITDDAPILLLKTMSTILALATFLAMGGLLFARGFIAATNMMHAKIKKGEAP